jgi:hypothetical protein
MKNTRNHHHHRKLLLHHFTRHFLHFSHTQFYCIYYVSSSDFSFICVYIHSSVRRVTHDNKLRVNIEERNILQSLLTHNSRLKITINYFFLFNITRLNRDTTIRSFLINFILLQFFSYQENNFFLSFSCMYFNALNTHTHTPLAAIPVSLLFG